MECKTVFGTTTVLTLTTVLILAFSLSGCGGNRLNNKKADVKSVIWEKQDQFVRIESQDRESILVQDNDHPAKLSPNLIRKTLGSLEVQFGENGTPVPVFSQDELEILSEPISRGLAQAKPDEDVTFAISGIHQEHNAPEMSTYRLFVTNDQLNLIIGTLHRKSAENSDLKFPLVPASRTYVPLDQRQTSSWMIVPRGGLKFKTSGALASDVITRPDWLILNLIPETFGEAAQMWEDSAQFQAEQQDIHQKIEKMERSIEEIKQTSQTTAPMTAPTAAESTSREKIKQRLEFLQELKNEGLVTDEDFRIKKQEILDSF